jgi:RNA-directed DNA polymerase
MQGKLAMWSTENKERKFDRLLRLIADKSWLAEAARITLASSGARTPGVDGVDKVTMEGNLHHELATIHDELLAGSYMPLPARRVYIPKANGKMRPLGIPSLRDRIVQRAMLMAMEPIWESDFHRASYGFRPAREGVRIFVFVSCTLTLKGGTYGSKNEYQKRGIGRVVGGA